MCVSDCLSVFGARMVLEYGLPCRTIDVTERVYTGWHIFFVLKGEHLPVARNNANSHTDKLLLCVSSTIVLVLAASKRCAFQVVFPEPSQGLFQPSTAIVCNAGSFLGNICCEGSVTGQVGVEN